MRVVIVSWYFPPSLPGSAIGAIRMNKMARYLEAAGHEVRVVTAERPEAGDSPEVEIDPAHVVRTPYVDVDALVNPRMWRRSGGAGSEAASAAGEPRSAPEQRSWLKGLSEIYRNAVLYPDRFVGWSVHLVPGLVRLVRRWRPDLILVSGPPFSPFSAVAAVAGWFGVPWIAEFRDRWADDPYFPVPAWRRRFDHWFERRVVRRAAGITTVSEPWSELYARKYGLPTATVMNGFDPADFAVDGEPAAGLPLRILHAGTIYQGRRDPSALFRALSEDSFGPDEVRIVFYGRYLESVRERSAAYGVGAFIETHPPIPYREAIRLQKGADVLLLLQWNDPGDRGNVPAKLFEYFAVRRPILGLGPTDGVPARLVRERAAGLFSNDPAEIAGRLRAWIEEKRATGVVAPLPETARHGLSRDEQYQRLERFLVAVAAKTPCRAGGDLREAARGAFRPGLPRRGRR